jgi:sortase A
MATRRQVQPAPSDAWGPLPPHAIQPPTRPRSGGRAPILKLIERILLIVAIACLGYYGYVSAETMLYQAQENRALDELLLRNERAPRSSSPAAAVPARRVVAPGETVGRIEIPRLGVSAIIKAGTDARTLQLAVGHIPGTAFPGQTGNVGLAAHRDTFFRRLRDIESEDEIRLSTPEGAYAYRVARTDIVEPEDVWVLDPTEHPALTLVTCYPFNYVGSAPQRFIVRAERIEGSGLGARESRTSDPIP